MLRTPWSKQRLKPNLLTNQHTKRSWEKSLENSKALETTLLKTLISSAFLLLLAKL